MKKLIWDFNDTLWSMYCYWDSDLFCWVDIFPYWNRDYYWNHFNRSYYYYWNTVVNKINGRCVAGVSERAKMVLRFGAPPKKTNFMDEKKVKEVFQMIEEHFINDYLLFGQVTYQRAKELTENIEIIKKIREIEKENLSK